MARKSDSKHTTHSSASKRGNSKADKALNSGNTAKSEKSTRKGSLQSKVEKHNNANSRQVRKVSLEDIQYVQNLIERCLQQYMAQKDVVYALQHQARIEPGFTTLVWQKLEEQNPEFFSAYHIRLKLKEQVILFNHLLEQQVQMIQKIQASQGGWGAQQGKAMVNPMHMHGSTGFPIHNNLPLNGMIPPHMPMGQEGPHGHGSTYLPMGHPANNEMKNSIDSTMFDFTSQGMLGNAAIPTSDGHYLPHGRSQGTLSPGSNPLELPQGEGQSHTMPKVFSLSDLTLELGAQLATEGDTSLSLLAGNDSSGFFPRNLSLTEIAKLESQLDIAE